MHPPSMDPVRGLSCGRLVAVLLWQPYGKQESHTNRTSASSKARGGEKTKDFGTPLAQGRHKGGTTCGNLVVACVAAVFCAKPMPNRCLPMALLWRPRVAAATHLAQVARRSISLYR